MNPCERSNGITVEPPTETKQSTSLVGNSSRVVSAYSEPVDAVTRRRIATLSRVCSKTPVTKIGSRREKEPNLILAYVQVVCVAVCCRGLPWKCRGRSAHNMSADHVDDAPANEPRVIRKN